MECLESHFLQKFGKFFFGRDFVEVEGIGIAMDELVGDFFLLYFSYASFVALDDLHVAVGEGCFVFLFHIIVFYKKMNQFYSVPIKSIKLTKAATE